MRILEIIRKTALGRRLIDPISLNVQYLKYKSILDLNKEYKDKYKGKRCFILGNGPSLKTQELSGLKNEITMVVNNFMLSDVYDQIEPTFYVIGDSNFFNSENKVLVENILSIPKHKHKPTCFFPIKKKTFIDNIGLSSKLHVLYVLTECEKSKINKIDIEKYIPKAFNVVNTAIYLALGMGFSEIYLLGVDMTSMVAVYDETGIKSDAGHFYEEKGAIKEHYMKLVNGRDNEYMLGVYAKVFKKFKEAKLYADSVGVKIINLTPKGALDVFPLSSLKSVLNSK